MIKSKKKKEEKCGWWVYETEDMAPSQLLYQMPETKQLLCCTCFNYNHLTKPDTIIVLYPHTSKERIVFAKLLYVEYLEGLLLDPKKLQIKADREFVHDLWMKIRNKKIQ